jgi:RimJ/RimL family protein N-acetyltransferase
LLGPPVPTFERWEATELQEVLQGGPALIVEDQAANYLGLVRLYRLELRDQRSYVDFRLVEGIDGGSALEACWAFLNYAFEFFNLRKVYAEVLSSEESMARLLERLGFEEEVRLEEYVRHGDAYLDLVYPAVTREAWAIFRERVAATLDVSAMAEQSLPEDFALAGR